MLEAHGNTPISQLCLASSAGQAMGDFAGVTGNPPSHIGMSLGHGGREGVWQVATNLRPSVQGTLAGNLIKNPNRRRQRLPWNTNSATPACLPGEGTGSLGWLGPWHTMVCVTIAPVRLSVTTCCAGCHFFRSPTCKPREQHGNASACGRDALPTCCTHHGLCALASCPYV